MATIQDIARVVGVSAATVSNALNGKRNVGHAIRQKIRRAAQELGYRPNRAAQAMRTGQTRAIGLVLPDLTNPFFPELAQSVERTARKAGLLVCLIDSQGNLDGESGGFELLTLHAVDGIIWCPLGRQLPASLKNYRQPVVLIDRPRAGFDVVHSDYLMGGRLLAEYAVRMGHSRIGLLSGPQNLESARLRRDGFVRALPRDVTIAWEISVPFEGNLPKEAIVALSNRKKATLIVSGNDLIAINVMRCLAELGLKVPKDVSVTGFDNIKWSDVVTPRLTTVAQPVGAIGAKAVELLRERMSVADTIHRRTVFDVTLVERDSVRSLK
jgi:LacI family transcriptional regulator